MRLVVGACALLILIICLVFFTSPSESQVSAPAGPGPSGPLSIGIWSSEIANEGNSTVAVLRMFAYNSKGASIFAACQNTTLQKNLLILNHVSLPGINGSLKKIVGRELSRFGASYREVDANEAASAKDSVILSPNGAVPQELFVASQNLSNQNTRVVYLSLLEGKAIDSQGNVLALPQQLPEDLFTSVALRQEDWNWSAFDAVRQALLPPGAAQSDFSEGNFTLAIQMKNSSECRVVAIKGDSLRFVDMPTSNPLPGLLLGPASVVAGQNTRFTFIPDSMSEQGRDLKFTATLIGEKGAEGKFPVPSGAITNGWESRFELAPLESGNYVVRVHDQFGRLHASAHFISRGLFVSPAGQSGNAYYFNATLGGEPTDGNFTVSLDGKASKTYLAHQGKLTIFAEPSSGNHTLTFMHNGARFETDFVAKDSSFVSTYVKYAIPGVISLAAFYLLVRAGQKPKYRITFPHYAVNPLPPIIVSKQDLIEAYYSADKKMGGHRLPLYPQEIAACINFDGKCKASPIPDPSSVHFSLRELAASKEFSECNGGFLPSSELGGFSLGDLASLRLIHDVMLEQGRKFERSRRISLARDRKVLVLYKNKTDIAKNMKKGLTQIVAFESDEAIASFFEEISVFSRENSLLSIAIDNGAVVPIVCTRRELGNFIT